MPKSTTPNAIEIKFQINDLPQLGRYIRRFWPKPYFGAAPYIDALCDCPAGADMNTRIGLEEPSSVLRYFLVNAQHWRGPYAKAAKDLIKKLLAGKATLPLSEPMAFEVKDKA
jgi:hypothetical protein